MNSRQVQLLLLAAAGFAAACSEDKSAPLLSLQSPSEVTYDARCQRDTVWLSAAGVWTATTDGDWLTVCQPSGGGMVPLYIQQNDTGEPRRATLTVTAHDGQTLSVALHQMPGDDNGKASVNLAQHYGVGWGYDLSTDIADAGGLRGQVFDMAALGRELGDDALWTETQTGTSLEYVCGSSFSEMQTEMSAKFTGRADIWIASASVLVKFSRQLTEQVERQYVWCRDMRSVRQGYLAGGIDLYDGDVVRYCTTQAFRQSVSKDTPAELVRKYGTHLVRSATLGGKLDYYFTVSKTVSTEVEKIVTDINVKVLFVKKSWTEVDEDVWQEVQKDFIGEFQVTGGGSAAVALNEAFAEYSAKKLPVTDAALFDHWYACFENPATARDSDLAMIDFEVIPLWDIIRPLNEQKAQAVERYVVETYLKKE